MDLHPWYLTNMTQTRPEQKQPHGQIKNEWRNRAGLALHLSSNNKQLSNAKDGRFILPQR